MSLAFPHALHLCLQCLYLATERLKSLHKLLRIHCLLFSLTSWFKPFLINDPELPDLLAHCRQGGVAAAFLFAMALAFLSALCLYLADFDRALPVLNAAPRTGSQYPAFVNLCSMPVSGSIRLGLSEVVG